MAVDEQHLQKGRQVVEATAMTLPRLERTAYNPIGCWRAPSRWGLSHRGVAASQRKCWCRAPAAHCWQMCMKARQVTGTTRQLTGN